MKHIIIAILLLSSNGIISKPFDSHCSKVSFKKPDTQIIQSKNITKDSNAFINTFYKSIRSCNNYLKNIATLFIIIITFLLYKLYDLFLTKIKNRKSSLRFYNKLEHFSSNIIGQIYVLKKTYQENNGEYVQKIDIPINVVLNGKRILGYNEEEIVEALKLILNIDYNNATNELVILHPSFEIVEANHYKLIERYKDFKANQSINYKKINEILSSIMIQRNLIFRKINDSLINGSIELSQCQSLVSLISENRRKIMSVRGNYYLILNNFFKPLDEFHSSVTNRNTDIEEISYYISSGVSVLEEMIEEKEAFLVSISNTIISLQKESKIIEQLVNKIKSKEKSKNWLIEFYDFFIQWI